MAARTRQDLQRDMLIEQLDRRCRRGREEIAKIINRGSHLVYSTFDVTSVSGRQYRVQIRSLTEMLNSCQCPDYKTNTLGTCKHIEGVLQHLHGRFSERWNEFIAQAPSVVEVLLQREEEAVVRLNVSLSDAGQLKSFLSPYFDAEGVLLGRVTRTLPALLRAHRALPPHLRDQLIIHSQVMELLKEQQDVEAVAAQKEWFLEQVKEGRRSFRVIDATLYPYQEQGVMHLAFGRRVVLADDMGLGKTVQAMAAAALLQQLRDIRHVLVVTPSSLKHQWEREIRRFTSFPVQVIEGKAIIRRNLYRQLKFFNIVNYESLLRDESHLTVRSFDLVILDEAQRIKNWRTKTAACVKRLRCRYAFVLTGTPLENRLDDLYSIFQFVDPHILGPLWRYNERYFEVERRPSGTYKVLGYKNLGELRRRIAPYVLRRTRDEVLLDLPGRIDNNYFVEMTARQMEAYEEYELLAARLLSIARKRPLTPDEHKYLQGHITKMRLICNALALHDPEIPLKEREKTSPKLKELREILHEEVVGNGHKAIIFSQWTSMLSFCEPVLEKLGIGWVKLTGEVPSLKRGGLIDRFFQDPRCRVFLSSDAGGVGLNLQAASLVINLDLPWNPAVLDQRIARAHRHGQKRPVQVINLIAKGTIEERILDTLSSKRTVFDAALNESSDIDVLSLQQVSSSVLQRLQILMDEKTRVRPDLELDPSRKEGLPAAEPHPMVPEAEVITVAGLAEEWAAHYPGRILLVQKMGASASGQGPAKILVVVDKDPAILREALTGLSKDRLEQMGDPEIALMDQESYHAFRTLMGDAAEQFSTAFQSPAMAATGSASAQEGHRYQLDKAEKGLKTAQRRLELARLVLDGGFPEEALRPLRQSAALGLNAALCLQEDQSIGEVLPSPRSIESRLVASGILAGEEAAQIERLRMLSEPTQEDDEALPAPSNKTLGELLTLIQGFIERLGERCAAERLKPL